MIILDNKKARTLDGKGLIDVATKGKVTMSSIQQNLLTSNNQPLVIGEFSIRQDEDGRYCLHDLHKASGGNEKHQPAFYLRNKQTKELIEEIDSEKHSANLQSAVKVINGGNDRGTYAVKEMVYAYAMWISAKFHLMVIRAYDALVTNWILDKRESISPEQQALLHEIVARRSSGERKVYAEMWARHNRHFKIPRYAELLSIHFPDSIHYLETMEIKGKPETKKAEPVALPYPQQVVRIAQQINQEFAGGRYTSWLVSARDGDLSATPLPHGYYPAMDLGEFTKHFDGILNILYASGALNLGRQMLKDRDSK